MSDAILLVDDEPSVLSALCRSLRGEPYEVLSELSGESALQRMAEQPVKVVVSDERMAKMQGSEFLAIARREYPGTVRILLTGQATLDAAVRAVNEGGIYKFLTKPWNDKNLKQVIQEALVKYDTEQEVWNIFRMLQKKRNDLAVLESQFPGISQINRDAEGNLLLPELSDGELEFLRQQCEQAFIGQLTLSSTAQQVQGMLLKKFMVG